MIFDVLSNHYILISNSDSTVQHQTVDTKNNHAWFVILLAELKNYKSRNLDARTLVVY